MGGLASSINGLAESTCNNSDKEKIVWADGCYDVGHFGHANSLRQARAFGTRLIVGVHSDDEILKHKGCLPVFNQEERYAMIRAMRFVDDVIEDAPYVTTLATLDKHGAQFCAHGNDITTTKDGIDTYQIVKNAGRYKEVDRTRGVSTTDIIQRILNFGRTPESNNNYNQNSSSWTEKSQFLLTAMKTQQFCGSKKKSDDYKVVYAAGAFDIFHPGDIEFLKASAALGDYLIVGVYDDATVRAYEGSSYLILNLTERFLSVLACKYVDNVIIGAPYTVTKDLIEEFNVSIVAVRRQRVAIDPLPGEGAYALPDELVKLEIIDLTSTLTTADIVARVQGRRTEFEERNAQKVIKDKELNN